MGWASSHIALLRSGQTVSFRPCGTPMSPRIESGQLCTVAPVNPLTLCPGDIVLCHVHPNDYLHIVKAIDAGHYQIGNNRARINGWILATSIFGILTKLEARRVARARRLTARRPCDERGAATTSADHITEL